MATKVTKAILPIAGLGTRFLPLSKVLPKEFFPLKSKPVIQYIIEEAIEAGGKEFIFVISPRKIYFLQKWLTTIPRIKYRYVIQKKPLGDGDAILKAEKLVG